MKASFAFKKRILSSLVIIFVACVGNANTITINFDSLADGELVTGQYAPLGITFGGDSYRPGMVITTGVSGNEIDFPPHSGDNVLVEDTSVNGLFSASFSAPVTSVGGYFTYVRPILLQAYDVDGNLLASATSAQEANYVGAGTPNELLQVASGVGISRIIVEADPSYVPGPFYDPSGPSFTLDDLTFVNSVTAVPDRLATGVGLAVCALIYSLKRKGN